MNVRHFVGPDGTMYRITSEQELNRNELEAVLSHMKRMDPCDLGMGGAVTLQIAASA